MSKSSIPTKDDYLLAVGRGLEAWSRVENEMFRLFLQESGTMFQEGLLIFGAILSLEARLSVLNELMLLRLRSHTDKGVWIKLAARIQKYYKRRHGLAHFTFTTSADGPEDSAKKTLEFRPLFTLTDFYLRSKPALTLIELSERTERFNEISDAVEWFQIAMRFYRAEPPEEPQVRAPDLIQRFRMLIDPTLQAPPRQSSPE